MATPRALALALRDAERGTDEEEIISAQNDVLDHLNVPLDWTEQGLNEQASALLDIFVERI